MRVFIAGATGVLGRALIKQFVARGHFVLGLARNDEGARVVESLGGESRRADIFDADALARAAVGSDVLIHAATSIPAKTRTKARDWEMNDRLRREGTRALTSCAAKIGAKLYLQQSIVWLARPGDGAFFDETAEPQTNDPVTLSAFDAERIAREAGERDGFNAAVLRCGLFYGPDASHTRMMGEMLLKRKFPIIGSGDAVLSCLHTDDAAGAFVAAAEGNKKGLWHVVDDENVRVKELLTGFAERLCAPPPRHVPAWLARLVAGSYTVNFFTSSIRTSNARFRADFGWSPRFPSYREGLDQVVEAWKAEGFGSK
ncbi:MAG TPA: NAD-dependent epimerase/dehydratase family protein [Pyrinomonadaceae bacterium]|jgi:nucleoside-diphosphate-sugar epimerase